MDSEQLKNGLESTKKMEVTVTAKVMALMIMLNIVCLIIDIFQKLQLEQRNIFEIVAICFALIVTAKFIVEFYKAILYFTTIICKFIINTLYSFVRL